jgi:hypothetical protein
MIRTWLITGKKLCPVCKIEKTLNEFAERRDRASYESRCKICDRQRHERHRAHNRGLSDGRTRKPDYQRDWYEQNKQKYEAGLIPLPEQKRCWRCKVFKPPTEFGISRSHQDGLNPSCKACAREYSKKVGNRKKTKHDHRRANIRHSYRLGPEKYNELLRRQSERCAICDEPFRFTPHVDHDHETGAVRGLLCATCNALMAALDKKGYLDKAREYLRTVAERCG